MRRIVLVSLILLNCAVALGYVMLGNERPEQVNSDHNEPGHSASDVAIAHQLESEDAEIGSQDVSGQVESESPADSVLLTAAETDDEEVVAQDFQAQRVCRIWGPESKPENFLKLEENLLADGGLPEVISQEIEINADYMVAVTGIESYDRARQIAAELQEMGIENYLMPKNGDNLLISIGVFSQESRAKAQQIRVQELGYQVKIDTLKRSQKVYNLMAHIEKSSDFYDTSTSSCLDIAQER